MQTTVTGLKCNNENSDMYGEYVDPNCTCKNWGVWEEMKPEEYLKKQVKDIAKENNKKTLKDKIVESYKHYQNRLEEELEYKNTCLRDIRRIEGRIEILTDIIDDLKHDLEDANE
jgi:hypothetical protein